MRGETPPQEPPSAEPVRPEFIAAVIRREQHLRVRSVIREACLQEIARQLGHELAENFDCFHRREEVTALLEQRPTHTRPIGQFDVAGRNFTVYRQGLSLAELRQHCDFTRDRPFQPLNWAAYEHLIGNPPEIQIERAYPGELNTVREDPDSSDSDEDVAVAPRTPPTPPPPARAARWSREHWAGFRTPTPEAIVANSINLIEDEEEDQVVPHSQ